MNPLAAFTLVTMLLATATVSAQVNVAPTLTLAPETLQYEIGQGNVVVDATATVSDPDSPDMALATLTVTLASPDPLVMLSITSGGGVTISGSNIKSGPTTVGVFVYESATSTLEAVFNSSTNLTIVQTVLRNVIYANTTSVEPQTQTLSFVLDDGDGGISEPAQKTIQIGTSVAVPSANSGVAAALHPAIPNPFNPGTTIRFDLPESGQVELTIYDVAGRRVRTLVQEVRNAGSHDVIWRGQDDSGQQVASGVYLYRLEAGSYVETRRMTLLN